MSHWLLCAGAIFLSWQLISILYSPVGIFKLHLQPRCLIQMSWGWLKEAYHMTLEKDLSFEEFSSVQYLPPAVYPWGVTVSRTKGSAVCMVYAWNTST